MNSAAVKEDLIVSSPALIMATYLSEKYTWFCKMGVRKLIAMVYIKGEIVHLELNTVGITIAGLKDAVDREGAEVVAQSRRHPSGHVRSTQVAYLSGMEAPTLLQSREISDSLAGSRETARDLALLSRDTQYKFNSSITTLSTHHNLYEVRIIYNDYGQLVEQKVLQYPLHLMVLQVEFPKDIHKEDRQHKSRVDLWVLHELEEVDGKHGDPVVFVLTMSKLPEVEGCIEVDRPVGPIFLAKAGDEGVHLQEGNDELG
ncbi:hypothetical protein ARMGADRAFT_1028465 [Armillaria gallica]|uniref:Uncharacterized protein n=1 Tax=Armillaria gallica TaxID=47427 RepID=A0A2H3DII8_ARMGA|nr:hypothetical protein ARMGADRAFT_1028465 [Armillaria gallica]